MILQVVASTSPGGPVHWSAVVLTGGTGERLGGVDKGSLEVAGARLLDHALAAVTAAAEVVVVGQRVPTARPVLWAMEDPPRGGPAAGLLAGVDRFADPPDVVAVLAVDMPRVGAATFERLLASLAAAEGADGAVLVDASGHRQTLAAAYRRSALSAARPASSRDEHGLSMRRLVGSMRLVEVAALGEETRDVDTWEDLVQLDALPDRSTRTTLER
jgi:molybdopterin-guanine dinucleotide biosynthesis protein A